VQRGKRGPVGGGEALVAGQVPEHVAVGDERAGVLTTAAGEPGEGVGELVDDLDRLALLVGALGIAGQGALEDQVPSPGNGWRSSPDR